jgi:hypothetical protein
MTLRDRITEVLAPAINTGAPFAKFIIARLIEIAEDEYLRGSMDTLKGAPVVRIVRDVPKQST